MNGTSGSQTRFICARCGAERLRSDLEPKSYPLGAVMAETCLVCWGVLTRPLGMEAAP